MWYAIYASDQPDSLELRKQNRVAHLARLEALAAQGRLLVAGPMPAIDAEDPGPAGFAGSLVVARFESREAAETWVAEDPYRLAGVYESAVVRPFLHVLP